MQGPASGGRESLWPFLVLSVANLVACLYYFPAREIFSGEPLLTGDYVVHFLEALRVGRYLRDGSFLGYSTTWMAGFPDGFNSMVKNKPFCLLLALVPPQAQPLVFNLGVLVALWLFPPLVYVAARTFGHDRRVAAVSMALSMFAFYGSGLFRIFWRGGSIVFIVASAAALWATAGLWRLWSGDDRRGRLLPTALGIAVLPWIHPGAALVAILGGAMLYVTTLRVRGLRIAHLLGISAITIALNLPWLWTFFARAYLRSSLYYPIYQGGLDHLLLDFVRAPLHLGFCPRDETAVLSPLLVGAIAAAPLLRDRPGLWRLFAGLAVGLSLIAYAGSWLLAIATLQPYRYTVPLAALLSIAAAPLFANPRRLGRLTGGLSLVLVLVLADRVRVARRAGDYLGAGLGTADRWALEQLRLAAAPSGTVEEGRVLLEGDWIAEPVEGRPGARRVVYSFLALERYLGGEFIGAPAMGVAVPQDYASSWRGQLFGRPLVEYDTASFLRICDLYDIRWVVTAREAMHDQMRSFAPAVSEIASSGPTGLFRVERRPSRLWKGSGDAQSDGQRILVQLRETGPAVLKYHWIPGLAAEPRAELAPVRPDPSSPLPFVEIRAPVPGPYSIHFASDHSASR